MKIVVRFVSGDATIAEYQFDTRDAAIATDCAFQQFRTEHPDVDPFDDDVWVRLHEAP